MLGWVPGWGNKNNEKSIAGWVEYSQNATLVFIIAYVIYVFLCKITIPLSTHLYQQRYLIWRRRRDLEPLSSATPTSLLFFAIAQNKEDSHGSLASKHKEHRLTAMLFVFGGEGGTWTLAPVTRPTPLAGAPRHQLEYFSIYSTTDAVISCCNLSNCFLCLDKCDLQC